MLNARILPDEDVTRHDNRRDPEVFGMVRLDGLWNAQLRSVGLARVCF